MQIDHDGVRGLDPTSIRVIESVTRVNGVVTMVILVIEDRSRLAVVLVWLGHFV